MSWWCRRRSDPPWSPTEAFAYPPPAGARGTELWDGPERHPGRLRQEGGPWSRGSVTPRGPVLGGKIKAWAGAQRKARGSLPLVEGKRTERQKDRRTGGGGETRLKQYCAHFASRLCPARRPNVASPQPWGGRGRRVPGARGRPAGHKARHDSPRGHGAGVSSGGGSPSPCLPQFPRAPHPCLCCHFRDQPAVPVPGAGVS